MQDIQLSPHFKLSEFTKSATADQLHIKNTLDPANPADAEIIANLRNLCVKLLEPLRQHFGIPIIIESGYRCPSLNRAVGGAANSQHMKGEAADLRIPTMKTPNPSTSSGQVPIQDMPTARKWIEWLLDQRFDQLILEHTSLRPCSGQASSAQVPDLYWIHISLKRNDSKNRQTYIPNLSKK